MKRVALLLLLITSFSVVKSFFNVLGSLWTVYEIFAEASDNDPSPSDLVDQIADVKNDINQVTKDVTRRIDQLYQQLIVQLPKIGQINRGLETFSRHFNRISYLYKVFERMVRPPRKKPSERALREFSTVALGIFSDSVDATLEAIHELLVPTEIGHLNDGLLTLLVQNLPIPTEMRCNTVAPPQEQFYLLFTALVTAEVRGFMMLTFTYGLLQTITNVDYSADIRAGRSRAMVRIQEYMWQIRDVVNWTSSIYYPCDPPGGYKRGVSFAEFEMFESFYLVNQYSVEPDCRFYCRDLDYTVPALQELKCADEDGICQTTEKCTGRISQCVETQADFVYMCPNPDKEIGSRRYLYVSSGSEAYGDKGDCKADEKRYNSFTKYSSHTDKNHRCSYCKCTCVEQQPSGKFFVFNVRPQMADIEENKIVAGIKFTMTSHVLHIQIRQGVVQHDKFAADTLEWKPVDVMQLDESKITNSSELPLYNEKGRAYMEDIDYVRLLDQRKVIMFDDLVAPDGYVVTGARLNRPRNNNRAIQLEIHATAYNFTSGKVIVTNSRWIDPMQMKRIYPDYTQSLRFAVQVGNIEGKARFDTPTAVLSKPYSWTKLKLSNLGKDISGTVLPLVDIREVSPPHPFLLQGIGLMYKEHAETKGPGYLSFNLYSVNRRKFLDVEITV